MRWIIISICLLLAACSNEPKGQQVEFWKQGEHDSLIMQKKLTITDEEKIKDYQQLVETIKKNSEIKRTFEGKPEYKINLHDYDKGLAKDQIVIWKKNDKLYAGNDSDSKQMYILDDHQQQEIKELIKQ